MLSTAQKNSLKAQLDIVFVKLENKLSTPAFIDLLRKTSTKLDSKISS